MVEEQEQFFRIRTPRKGELLGVVTGLMGASRVRVECLDGKERLCRIPGKIKRNIWVKVDDTVIVEPWEIDLNRRGDIVWRYTRIQTDWLKRKGFFKPPDQLAEASTEQTTQPSVQQSRHVHRAHRRHNAYRPHRSR